MSVEQVIEALEAEWSPEDGFFWQVRQGNFEGVAFERAMHTLSMISFAENAELPRRIVSLLWYVPLFMRWQIERVQEKSGGDTRAYEDAVTTMTNEVERILGVP
jgi:hypothetical protein